MSTTEARLQETPPSPAPPPTPPTRPGAQLLPAREVPLGGPRAMTVRRSLPSRARTTVGAWCFVDSYGPATGGAVMLVPPHPHTGLQTVTWLLSGEVLHEDSTGATARVRPGGLALMTGGDGVAHAERSLPADGAPLHGVQLWVALPEEHRHRAASFEHHEDLPVRSRDGVRTTVLVGDHDGMTSPATAWTPLLGVEVRTEGPAPVRLPLDPAFEHAVLLVSGALQVAGERPAAGDLVHLGTGRDGADVDVTEATTFLLLGGEPFAERLVMWWNFVGRSHEDVVAAREQWQARADRFGDVPGWDADAWLRAPALPRTRLLPRG